jgi:hypothetical protein
MSRRAGQAPGVVKVRLSGDPADLERFAQFLTGGSRGAGEAVEVIEESGLYANRRDPGCRLYLTVRLIQGDHP